MTSVRIEDGTSVFELKRNEQKYRKKKNSNHKILLNCTLLFSFNKYSLVFKKLYSSTPYDSSLLLSINSL